MGKWWRILSYFVFFSVCYNTGVVRQGSDSVLNDFIEIYLIIWQYLVSQSNVLIERFLIMIHLLLRDCFKEEQTEEFRLMRGPLW